ncbi:MAG: FixH family protein [Pseudomonadota bacterium]
MSMFRTIFRPDEFTGYHMAGIMALFFGTIISVNMFLAFNAVGTWTGLMVKNPYVESQKFNQHFDRFAAQSALGWEASVTANAGTIDVVLVDAAEKPITNAIVTGMLGRPVHEGEDRTIAFTEVAGGYQAQENLDPGLWRVQVQAIGTEGEVWTRTFRFIVKSTGGAN